MWLQPRAHVVRARAVDENATRGVVWRRGKSAHELPALRRSLRDYARDAGGLHLQRIEKQRRMTEDAQRRFGGIARLYGRAGFERLQAAHVAVVGVGGVGSWTVEALARSGIG